MDSLKTQAPPENKLHFLDYWRIIRIRKTVILAVFLLVVITATLVTKKVKKTRRLFVRISFADTGAVQSEFRSPFQKGAFRAIAVSVFDSDGDGVADTVRLTARKGKKTLTRLLTV